MRTCTDVPAGILAYTSAIAIDVASMTSNAIANFRLRYQVITRPKLVEILDCFDSMLGGEFGHWQVSKGHVHRRHKKKSGISGHGLEALIVVELFEEPIDLLLLQIVRRGEAQLRWFTPP